MAPRHPDLHATVVDEDTFTLIADLEVRKAVRLQYYVSLLAIDVGLPEPLAPEAAAAARRMATQIAERISHEIRGTDLIGLTRAWPHLYVLLVSAHLYNLPTVIERITRAVNAQPVEPGLRPGAVQLRIGGGCFPTTARARQDLFSQAASLATEAGHEPTHGHQYRLAPAAL